MNPRASAPTTLVMPRSAKWAARSSTMAAKASASAKAGVRSLNTTPGFG